MSQTVADLISIPIILLSIGGVPVIVLSSLLSLLLPLQSRNAMFNVLRGLIIGLLWLILVMFLCVFAASVVER